MVSTSLKARIATLERQRAAGNWSGLGLLEFLVKAFDKSDGDVIALEVGPHDARQRVMRIPGESITQLEARANPAGCWRASPGPIFDGDRGETEACEMLRLVLVAKEEYAHA